MSKFIDILKKDINTKVPELCKKEKEDDNVNEETNNDNNNLQYDPNIKNPNDEFEREYMSKIFDLKLEFKDEIEQEGLPFMNRLHNVNYTFFDYIKYNSNNFRKIINKVTLHNEEYLREINDDDNDISKIYDNVD